MSTKVKHLKTRFPSNPGYHPETRLLWWGTLVGDVARERFMIAAPTKKECIAAARDFFPDAMEEHVQPISVRKRNH
jgi:hypothetical protein